MDSLCLTNLTRGQDLLRSFYPLLAVKRGKKSEDWQDMHQECGREIAEITIAIYRLLRLPRFHVRCHPWSQHVSLLMEVSR